MKKECCDPFSESFQILMFDSSHHKVNLPVNQFQDFLSQFTFMFLCKIHTCMLCRILNIIKLVFKVITRQAKTRFQKYANISRDESESRSITSSSLRPIYSPWISRPEYWGGQLFPSGDLPNPETEPRSLALQVDSLSAEPPGNPVSIDGYH